MWRRDRVPDACSPHRIVAILTGPEAPVWDGMGIIACRGPTISVPGRTRSTVATFEDILEDDLNPVIAASDCALAVRALVVLTDG